jgi:hypothetical protein
MLFLSRAEARLRLGETDSPAEAGGYGSFAGCAGEIGRGDLVTAVNDQCRLRLRDDHGRRSWPEDL